MEDMAAAPHPPRSINFISSNLFISFQDFLHYVASASSNAAGLTRCLPFLLFDAGPNPQQKKRRKKLREYLNKINEVKFGLLFGLLLWAEPLAGGPAINPPNSTNTNQTIKERGPLSPHKSSKSNSTLAPIIAALNGIAV